MQTSWEPGVPWGSQVATSHIPEKRGQWVSDSGWRGGGMSTAFRQRAVSLPTCLAGACGSGRNQGQASEPDSRHRLTFRGRHCKPVRSEQMNEEIQENFKTAPLGRTSLMGTHPDGGCKQLHGAIILTRGSETGHVHPGLSLFTFQTLSWGWGGLLWERRKASDWLGPLTTPRATRIILIPLAIKWGHFVVIRHKCVSNYNQLYRVKAIPLFRAKP